MRDTTPDVEAAFLALFAARTATERLKMTCAMFDTAKALMAAGIRAQHPDISESELRIRMFERMYSGDLDPVTQASFVAALRPTA